MITQPYKNLLLDQSRKEAAPATLMGDANAVQLTVVIYEANTSASVWVEGSNDAENWRILGSALELPDLPGFYVAAAATGVCTRYIRAACSVPDDSSVLLAITQQVLRV